MCSAVKLAGTVSALCVIQSCLANFIFLINTGPLVQQNLNSAWNESTSGRFQVFAQFPAGIHQLYFI